jgi:exodeoxyribonuclease-3
MGLAHKYRQLLSLNPDLAIVPECAEPSVIRSKACEFMPTSSVWIGANIHKGLGVFSFSGLKLKRHKSYAPGFRWIAPIEVSGDYNFNLLAVWAFFSQKRPQGYRGVVLEALERYKPFLQSKESVFAGDFNNNVIWDKPGRDYNHSSASQVMRSEFALESAYHVFHAEREGVETSPTFYWLWRKEHPYHIDYCYLPSSWVQRITDVRVGSYEDWRSYSDHVPVVIDVTL